MAAGGIVLRREKNPRFAVVRRPVAEVVASLERFGLGDLADEMERRNAALEEVAAEPDTFSIDFADLSRPERCAALYRHCTDSDLDGAWFDHMGALNVQVDMPQRLRLLTANAGQIAALKAEVGRRLAHA